MMARHFVFNWRVSLFALVCMAAFISLGLWQLAREDEKRALLALREARQQQPPMAAAQLPTKGDLHNMRVLLRGSFGEQTWLLDNRVLDGVVGFEVLQVFHDESDRDFVVNRGFVPMGWTRDELPDIPAAPDTASVVARVYQPGDRELLLGEVTVPDWQGRPLIVQSRQVEPLAMSAGMSLYPHLLRIQAGETGALPRHWPETMMMPQQHRGYAIQWFTMALAVAIVWILFSWRKTGDGTES